uniref:Uncharacterized protein n=1 Tax=Rhizophora mucronata TaxID=61149 RepID=A0A2P2JWL5_RHIMU
MWKRKPETKAQRVLIGKWHAGGLYRKRAK